VRREERWLLELLTIACPDPASTEAVGARLGAALRAGDLVLLAGPLGAGKTVLVRGIATGLGVSGRVASPTFVLAREHPAGKGGVAMVHADAYRLGGRLDELDALDLDTELTRAALVVEWGEGSAERLSAGDYLLVRIERRVDETRVLTVCPHGSWGSRLETLGCRRQGSEGSGGAH
jgi:tRNA threonylcarbamoyladenosine biosynthesis protein TsaE